jgi:type VI secretion system protein ImpG
MGDELLDYYNRELRYLRQMGEEFAAANPKVASHLGIKGQRFEDPHVSRLIEAFAYLNARTRRKIEDEFPEITDALLNILYPHYLAPIPSMAIASYEFDINQGGSTDGYLCPRGTDIETDPVGQPSVPCRFQSCYSVTLWPIKVTSAQIRRPPFQAPSIPQSSAVKSIIHIALDCVDAKLSMGDLAFDRLRLFLNDQPPYVYDLYEVLHNNVIEVAATPSPGHERPVFLGAGAIQPVGFDTDQCVLDAPARSFPGYQMLSEYFVFPEKYLFFDVAGLQQRTRENAGNSLHLFFYLDCFPTDLQHNVSRDTFRLDCTPIVNTFSKRAEPVSLTQTQAEYRIEPDARRPDAYEIHTVGRVMATSPDNEEVEFLPFYSLRHGDDAASQRAFWHAVRRARDYRNGGRDDSTDMFLALVDLEQDPSRLANWTLDVDTICINRDLAHRLPYGDGQPRLRLSQGGPIATVHCLSRPTATLRPDLGRGAAWRLISHLALNYLSLVDNDQGAEPLREILRLYDYASRPETASAIESIRHVSQQPVVQRVARNGKSAVCRGTEITVDFDESKLSGGGMFLFASVLERFVALYSSLNSFTTLIATSQQREGKVRQWRPRIGQQGTL